MTMMVMMIIIIIIIIIILFRFNSVLLHDGDVKPYYTIPTIHDGFVLDYRPEQ